MDTVGTGSSSAGGAAGATVAPRRAGIAGWRATDAPRSRRLRRRPRACGGPAGGVDARGPRRHERVTGAPRRLRPRRLSPRRLRPWHLGPLVSLGSEGVVDVVVVGAPLVVLLGAPARRKKLHRRHVRRQPRAPDAGQRPGRQPRRGHTVHRPGSKELWMDRTRVTSIARGGARLPAHFGGARPGPRGGAPERRSCAPTRGADRALRPERALAARDGQRQADALRRCAPPVSPRARHLSHH